jgi:hypothetical protein
MVQPTYSALEIKRMCTDFSLEYSIFKTIVDLVEEEFHLYSEDDLVILMQASMIMFTRSLLKLSLNNLR